MIQRDNAAYLTSAITCKSAASLHTKLVAIDEDGTLYTVPG